MPRGDIIAKQLWGDIFAELPETFVTQHVNPIQGRFGAKVNDESKEIGH